jgi:vitamin B12 transporter
MNCRIVQSFFAVFLATPFLPAQAEPDAVPELETTVVTATRSETPLRQVGSSVSVITAEDIAKRQVLTAADALRIVPGVDVLNSGGPGRQTSVLLRGGGSQHTLVLIDGVEMNDPSSPTNAFDFANLTVDNIERIEVLRGGESSLYGSDPLGGVVNIITKKGSGTPKYSVSGQGGSYDSFKVNGSVSGGTDLVDYSLASSHLETRGFSAADKSWGNPEPDGYRNSTVDTRLGVHPLENLDFGWNLRYNEGKTYLDYDYPKPHDALHYDGVTKELYTRGFGHLKLLDNLWEQTLGLAYSRTDRTSRNYDPSLPYSLDSDYLGEKVKVDWQNILHLHDTNTLTFGIEDEEDRLSSDSDPIGAKSYNTQGYYLLDQIKLWDRSFTTAAVRYDDNNRIGSKVTWRVTQAIVFDETDTKLKGSYGTGFKVPSLFDLYDKFTGNPNLAPETSRNWDIGFEQAFWDRRVSLGSTYFNNHFDNLIQYSFSTYKVQNISQAFAEGVENFVQVNPLENLGFRGNYTYTHTEDLTTGQRLIRRPVNKGSFEANYRFLENADVNLTILMVGEKNDIGGTRVPGYVLVNLGGGYQINDNFRLFARIDNIFDKHNQELYGYGTSRLAGYGGVALTF